MQVQLVGLEEVVEGCDRLARAILESDFHPDVVVAIARGGFMPARFLCDFLDVGKLTSIRIRHYEAGAQKGEEEANVTIPLSVDIEGLNVLLVDDVNDSGETLRAASSHLEDFSPSVLRSAVLHEKTTTVHRADFRITLIRQWRWILYPWALVEDVGHFIRQMSPAPRNLDEIRERLDEEYGFVPSPAQLDRVLYFGHINSHSNKGM